MGFLLSDAEYFMDLCRTFRISGKLLTLGLQDVWLTEDHFNELLQAKRVMADKQIMVSSTTIERSLGK